MERKTAIFKQADINWIDPILKKANAYPKSTDGIILDTYTPTVHLENLRDIVRLTMELADQEKEAEAVAFSEWKQENDMKRYIGYVSDEKVWRVYSYAPFYEKGKDFKTTSELYQIFKQQTGGK